MSFLNVSRGTFLFLISQITQAGFSDVKELIGEKFGEGSTVNLLEEVKQHADHQIVRLLRS